jgi:hypothetical protein
MKALSYGKLSKLVQTSIDYGHIKYFKTFLVKNTDRSSIIEDNKKVQDTEVASNKEIKLEKIHKGVIECLVENNNYLPLA